MSLLLDALNRASKEKAAAASGAAVAQPPSAPMSVPELALEVRARPEPLEASPAPDWPNLALSPEPELVVSAPAAAAVALEPAPPLNLTPVNSLPIVQTPKPEPAPRAPNRVPEIRPTVTAAPEAIAPKAVVQPASSGAHPARVAQDIQRAKAPAPAARPSMRLIVLGGVAGVLALSLSSVLLGWWGDPTAWFLPESRNTLVPATPMAASQPTIDESSEVTASVSAPVAIAEEPTDPPVAHAMAKKSAPTPARSGPKDERIESASAPTPAPEAKVAAKKESASIQRRSTGPSALELGYDALIQGRLKEATQAYNQALASNPEERDALLGLAYVAHQQGRDDEANAYYRRVLRQDPGNAVAQAGLIALGARIGGQDSASRARDVAEQNPKSAAAQVMLGHSLVRENRLADAQQAFYQAHLLEPAVASHAFNLAVALDRMRNYVSARRYYEMALTLSAQSGGERASNVPHAAVQARLEQLRSPAVADSLSTLPQ